MIQYYKTYWRELWFFANKINMDYESQDIAIGRLIHEDLFMRIAFIKKVSEIWLRSNPKHYFF